MIDSHALIYRFYHALPPLSAPSGELVGGVYGLARVLMKIIKEQKPDYMAAVFDLPSPTFRDEMYQQYKIHRPKAPEDLIKQIKRAHQLFDLFGVKIIERAGFEADDIIGSLAEKFKKEKDLVVIILSGDLDLLQLADDKKVVVQFLKKGISETIIYDEEAVKSRYNLQPSQIPDLKGLLGDTSDNIPGVSGIGPKTATPLIQKFGSLENLFDNLWELPEKIGNKLESQKETALLSKKLAVIKTDMDMNFNLNNFQRMPLDRKKITLFFEELGFQSLIQILSNL